MAVPAKRSDKIAEKAQFDGIRRMSERIRELAIDPADAGDDFILELMDDMLANMDNMDQVFAIQNAGSTSAEDIVNRPFFLQVVEWHPSSDRYVEEGGYSHFARVTGVEIATGDTLSFTAGGKTLVTALFCATEGGHVSRWQGERGQPGMPVVVMAKKATSGYDFHLLQPYKLPA